MTYKMHVDKDLVIDLTSVEKNSMKSIDEEDGTGLPLSSVYNLPNYTFTQSYGQPFKPGDQWKPYHVNMSTLEKRIQTFDTWTSQVNLHPWAYANSGFFFTGDGDAVTCFFCGTTVMNWVTAEDINAEHKKHSPSCSYLKMIYGDDFHNINSREVTTPWSYGNPSIISGWGPFNTSMVKLNNRLNSFKKWPIQMVQRPIDLARSGFYYTTEGDKLTCFLCGISVLNWESTDLPNLEHKKHSPNCKFMHMTQTFLKN